MQAAKQQRKSTTIGWSNRSRDERKTSKSIPVESSQSRNNGRGVKMLVAGEKSKAGRSRKREPEKKKSQDCKKRVGQRELMRIPKRWVPLDGPRARDAGKPPSSFRFLASRKSLGSPVVVVPHTANVGGYCENSCL
jgi:hypothetical protein